MTTVRIDQAALKELERSPEVKAGLARFGSEVAQRAAQAAPKDTGAGAASIDYEVGADDEGAYVRVSWDADHFYLMFHEIGTSRKSARPFLRPALEAQKTL